MTLLPIRAAKTNAVPAPFTQRELVEFVQRLTGLTLFHAMAHPDHVAGYVRDLMTRNEPEWYPVSLHGCRHMVLKRGPGEYMCIDFTSAAYADYAPDGVYFLLQWETPAPEELFEEAQEAELIAVSSLLAKWLESAASVQV